MTTSPLPWHTDPFVPSFWRDSNQNIIADFHLPMYRADTLQVQSDQNSLAAMALLKRGAHANYLLSILQALVDADDGLSPELTQARIAVSNYKILDHENLR